MPLNENQLDYLQEKLNKLSEKQAKLANEVAELQSEIISMKGESALKPVETIEPKKETQIPANTANEIKSAPKSKLSLERFIGENLISKIGIIITIIGVAIGVKYAVENQVISPTIRIVLGYLVGSVLLGLAVWLKRQYESFSAVLLSGSAAIMYFITFAAYSFYNLYPQWLTFALMLIFTAFTVGAALKYNRQVIAHIGLVGAYAIPFLVSTGAGKVEFLFTYMIIINIGILAISLKKYWKPVYFSSLGFTWLIFMAWLLFKYKHSEHFIMAASFMLGFFLIFYLTFILFKTFKKESFSLSDIILLLANSFVFYFLGYLILTETEALTAYTGLFTFCNAALHSGVAIIILKQRQTDRNLFYFILGLALAFLTIAIPVELNGNWVTILWASEAAILFWIGRTQGKPFYEKLAYPLLSIAFASIIHDWSLYLGNLSELSLTPFNNPNFYSSLAVTLLFAFVAILGISQKYTSPIFKSEYLKVVSSLFIPAMFVAIAYFTFGIEIFSYWTQKYSASAVLVPSNDTFEQIEVFNKTLLSYRTIWLVNYSLLFFGLISYLTSLSKKNESLGKALLTLTLISVGVFLAYGLYLFGELREDFLSKNELVLFDKSALQIYIRYIAFAFLAIAIVGSQKLIVKHLARAKSAIAFDICVHVAIVWILSSELVNLMDLARSEHSYKLGLSILWGAYSLLMIIHGLWKGKMHVRIAAISLFAITFIKLFVFDIAHLNTLSKVIVFLSLGVLLLIISFLYNKYKHLIADTDD
jgi:uncharacterized membrane protein